jgi:hypothetical protein
MIKSFAISKINLIGLVSIILLIMNPAHASSTIFDSFKVIDPSTINTLLLTPTERVQVIERRNPLQDAPVLLEDFPRYRLEAILLKPEGSIWIINGKLYKQGEFLQGIDVLPKLDGEALRLGRQLWKVGEIFDTQTGRVLSGLEGAEFSSRTIPTLK